MTVSAKPGPYDQSQDWEEMLEQRQREAAALRAAHRRRTFASHLRENWPAIVGGLFGALAFQVIGMAIVRWIAGV